MKTILASGPSCLREVQPGIYLHSGLGLYLEEEATLVVADLHWAYADRPRQPEFLPPLGGEKSLEERLRDLVRFFQPHRMVWLGDSLHRVQGRAAAEAFLDEVEPQVDICLIQGNHDRFWHRAGLTSVQIGRFFLHHGHEAPAIPEGMLEIIGHEHPTLITEDELGKKKKVSALVESPRRLILPAFSPWAAALDWIPRLLPDETVWSIFPQQIEPWIGSVRAS